MESAPHLVLLSRDFYAQVLQQLLAQWAYIWLASKGLTMGTDAAMAYMVPAAW